MRARDYIPGAPAAGHITSGGYWHPGPLGNCQRCAVGAVMDAATCCRRVPASHPAAHNRAIRQAGRCDCACHGRRR